MIKTLILSGALHPTLGSHHSHGKISVLIIYSLIDPLSISNMVAERSFFMKDVHKCLFQEQSLQIQFLVGGILLNVNFQQFPPYLLKHQKLEGISTMVGINIKLSYLTFSDEQSSGL
jgi:hypothetical protein